MGRGIITAALGGLAVASCLAGGARAQIASPTSIPLQLFQENPSSNGIWRLGINIGIGSGAPQLYLFDSGSSLFNAVYGQNWWPGFTPNPSTNNAPSSSLPTGVRYCYGTGACRGYEGNIVQVPSLSFYAPGASAPAATLAALPGFQVNAVYAYLDNGVPTSVVNPTSPPVEGYFYGTFGAADFVSLHNGYNAGGVLGQTMISGTGTRQGYVVSANGQKNPTSNVNGPQQANGQTVSVGGQTRPVTPCSPCVTVGLTPAILGQFMVATPGTAGLPGMVPWTRSGSSTFPNPYGSGPGNNSTAEFGSNYTVTLTAMSGQTFTVTSSGLLDTGTANLVLNPALNVGAVSDGTSVNPGVIMTVGGATGSGGAVGGLANASPVTLTANTPTAANNAYYATFAQGATSTIGLSFFLQNSVLYDLTDQAVAYTPFFVTTAALATTASGPLIVDASNVPLGLAGVVSGPGGITVNSGAAVQLSAANTYTGVTTIAGASGGQPAGQLLVSGQGSIANSAAVVNNGIFDISRAWAPVAIQSLSGSGQVNLGGQNLTLTNAGGTFSGTMADGGSYPVGGGSLTLAGGALTFAGVGIYTGGTVVSGGSFLLSGSLIGGLTVLPGGSFAVAPGASLNNSSGTTINLGALAVGGTLFSDLFNAGVAINVATITGNVVNTGALANNGMVNGSISNAGTLAGSGTIGGDLFSSGMVAPGNSIGTLSVAGNFTQTAGGIYSVEVNGAGQSDLINVGGTAGLQGGAVSVYAQPGSTFASRTTYRILNAAGGLSGTFASVNELYPFLLSSLSYDANNAYLTLQIGGFAAAGATPAQIAVGTVLDANVNNAAGDFATVLSSVAVNTFTNAQAQATLQAISGNNYAGFSTSMVQGMQLFMNNFANQAGGGGSPMSNRVALAEACDVACDATVPPKWGAWGGALGGLGTVGAGQPVGTVTYNAGGFAAGLDRSITDAFRVGVTAGYSTGTQWVGGFDGLGRSNTFQVGLYGGFAQDKVYADGVIGYAYTQNQMWRNIAVPGLQPRTAYGQTGANQWYGQLETGYRFDLGTNANAFVTPFARLQAYTANQNAFTETGAQSLNLSVAQQTTNSLRSVIGAQLGGSMDLGWREKLAMQLRLGWSHEYADVGRPVTATLAGAPAMPFTTFGISPQRDGAVIGLSANTAIADATSVYLRYEGDISAQDSAHAITAGVRMTW